ncbi:MAG: hypothetical protein GKR91_19190 [Pseudomonadales bacterium]|nr:hypothetical protein [Pseudomonadales bacterium]
MKIVFTKMSDDEHAVRVIRTDGSEDSSVLNSRSFLRHDLAHFAVESELRIARGYWGSVAQGTALAGSNFSGSDIAKAESLAGPIQTLMRLEENEDKYLSLLERVLPEAATNDLAARIRDRVLKLLGHWKATPFGGDMEFEWDENIST